MPFFQFKHPTLVEMADEIHELFPVTVDSSCRAHGQNVIGNRAIERFGPTIEQHSLADHFI